MRMQFYLVLLGLMLMPFLISGCGVKPGAVEPPGGEDTGFPHSYPR